MKIIFLGFDFFSNCLDDLIAAGHQVVKIYCFKGNEYNFSTQIQAIAKKHNISLTFDRPKLEELKNAFQKEGAEILVSAAYPYRIPVANEGWFRGVNVHPTLLPDGRGPWPLPWLILKHRRKAGITLHKIAASFDTGDILLKKKIKLTRADDLEILSAKCRLEASSALLHLLDSKNFEKLWKKAAPQGKGSYWPMPTETEQTIQWDWPVKKIGLYLRAYGFFGCGRRCCG
jgi:methionyl-tRNA formyltransferase